MSDHSRSRPRNSPSGEDEEDRRLNQEFLEHQVDLQRGKHMNAVITI
jgi:hypothetical protein